MALITREGRPVNNFREDQPNFKERVKAGEDATLVFSQAAEYHAAMGQTEAWLASAQYRFLKAAVDKAKGNA
jgi:hypothetical protein